jgi:hypothetical protein
MYADEPVPAWRRPVADPEPDDPEPDSPERPARELPPWPDWTPPPPPAPAWVSGLGHALTQAHTAEERARALYEGYRDGPQYAASGRPSLQRYYDDWQEAVRRRAALQRQLARALEEAGR